jgi:hypothetical protein
MTAIAGHGTRMMQWWFWAPVNELVSTRNQAILLRAPETEVASVGLV